VRPFIYPGAKESYEKLPWEGPVNQNQRISGGHLMQKKPAPEPR
jgi:hypothetical protein